MRRPTGPWTPAVHALLRHLATSGFVESPRVLGIDDRDREILSYFEGETVGDADVWPTWTRGDDALTQVGRLLRRYHALVQDFRPAGELVWRFATAALGPEQIVCHNDLAPYNVIWRGGRIVGIIDWDVAGPGPPVSDLAFAAWSWVPLHHPSLLKRHGWDAPPDRPTRLRRLVDAYGLEDRDRFAERIPRRILASIDRIERGAAAGDPGFTRLRDGGYLEAMRMNATYAETLVPELQRAIEV